MRPAATRSTSPAAPWRPRWSSPRRIEPGAEAGTDRQEHEVLHPACDPLPALADGRQVDVVLDGDGKTQPVANVVSPESSLEAGDVRREPELSGVHIDDAGNADDRAVDQLGGEPARLRERVSEHADRLDRSVGVGSVELDVLARSHLAAQVTDRAAQEAGAEVEAEDERGLRHEVEKDSAVRRAGRGPAWSPAPVRPPGATAARARRSASRCRRGARSRPARWALRRGSSRAPCARSDPSAVAGWRRVASGFGASGQEPYSFCRTIRANLTFWSPEVHSRVRKVN